jgi:hypothetical protein
LISRYGSLHAVQHAGHSNTESTVLYFGIEGDDAIEVAGKVYI